MSDVEARLPLLTPCGSPCGPSGAACRSCILHSSNARRDPAIANGLSVRACSSSGPQPQPASPPRSGDAPRRRRTVAGHRARRTSARSRWSAMSCRPIATEAFTRPPAEQAIRHAPARAHRLPRGRPAAQSASCMRSSTCAPRSGGVRRPPKDRRDRRSGPQSSARSGARTSPWRFRRIAPGAIVLTRSSNDVPESALRGRTRRIQNGALLSSLQARAPRTG